MKILNLLISKIKEFCTLKSPFALSLEEWEEWDSKTQLEYPVKWWFCKTVPDFFLINFWWPVTRIVVDKWYWGFMYRFIPKHQYHIIKPSTLSPNYHNQYDLILHASFHVLVEFVEYEEEQGMVDWRATNEHSEFWDEAKRLIYWWKHIRPFREEWLNRDNPYPKGPIEAKDDEMWVLYNKYSNTAEYKNWKIISSIHQKAEQQFEIDDESYLIRLAKIRMFLWN